MVDFLIYNSKRIPKLYDKLDIPLLYSFFERGQEQR